MQVPQWAGPIPIWSGGSRLGPRAMSLWWVHDTDYFHRARNSFLELAGSSRAYVSRAILIKCEPT